MPAHPAMLLVPLIIEAVWFVAFTVFTRRVYRNLAPYAREGMRYIDERGRPTGPAAWVRWFELAFIIYHFPVLISCTYISGVFGSKRGCPQWVLQMLTVILYGGILCWYLPRR